MQLSSGPDSGARLSWTNAGVAIPPIAKLQHIYEMLFGKISPSMARQREYKIGVDTSILDLVNNSGRSFLQGQVVGGHHPVWTSHYFDTLKSQRRLDHLTYLNESISSSEVAWKDCEDPIST